VVGQATKKYRHEKKEVDPIRTDGSRFDRQKKVYALVHFRFMVGIRRITVAMKGCRSK